MGSVGGLIGTDLKMFAQQILYHGCEKSGNEQ